MPFFDVAIVNYNTRDLLLSCLETVYAEKPNKVIVVDNNSPDDSVVGVRREFPDTLLLENKQNGGYSTAANQTVAASTAKYLLLLNSDTLLTTGVLRGMYDYLEQNPHVAILGPRLLNPDGTLQRSCFPFPTLLDVFLDISNLTKLIGFIPVLRDRYLRTWKHDKPRSVAWVLGAALAIRREAFAQVNGFDESFFMYCEEVDLCYRLKQSGWQIHFAPVGDITHIGGASTRQRRTKMTVQLYASLAHFYRLHYPRFWTLSLVAFLRCVASARLVRDGLFYILTSSAEQRVFLKSNLDAWRSLLLTQWQKEMTY